MDESEQLACYRETLLRWSAKINLIGPEARENLDEHIDEALTAADVLRPEGEVLDFGSGGGLPAIPLAIRAPAARVHLVEGEQKKASFLKYVVRRCGLNSVVHGDRLERVLPRLAPELRFSLITSRAVGKPSEWIPLVIPRVIEGGRIALFQHMTDVPRVSGLEVETAVPLPRGESNYLLILKVFHVEHG